MLKYFIYLLSIVVLILLTLLFSQYFQIHGAVPAFLLLFVMIIAIQREGFDFYPVAILAGVYIDFASSLPVGASVCGLVLVGFLSHALYHRVMYYQFSWKQLPILAGLNIIGFQTVVFLFGFFVGRVENVQLLLPLYQFFIQSLLILAYSLIFTYPLYWLSGIITDAIQALEQGRRTMH